MPVEPVLIAIFHDILITAGVYALTGRAPFEAANVPAILTKHVYETAPLVPGENAFDREMREARERLKAQRDA